MPPVRNHGKKVELKQDINSKNVHTKGEFSVKFRCIPEEKSANSLSSSSSWEFPRCAAAAATAGCLSTTSIGRPWRPVGSCGIGRASSLMVRACWLDRRWRRERATSEAGPAGATPPSPSASSSVSTNAYITEAEWKRNELLVLSSGQFVGQSTHMCKLTRERWARCALEPSQPGYEADPLDKAQPPNLKNIITICTCGKIKATNRRKMTR